MPDVARHKYNSGAAVEDLPREAQVIEAVTAQAVEAGLDKGLAAKFFQAQIDASKMIQSERIAAWKAEGHAPFTGVPDLKTVIRPKLDALTPALLAALMDTLPELKLPGVRERLEAYTVGRSWEDESAFRRAIAPLIAMAVLLVKIFAFIFFFMWVRWTVPRFRYDQLMNLGWKVLIPLAIANIVITGIVIVIYDKL